MNTPTWIAVDKTLINVAVPTPVHGTFTYAFHATVPPGSRVLVPFGKRQLIGVAVAAPARMPESGENSTKFAIKEISSVIDEVPVYSPKMLELAQWMSTYYLHPIGEVLRAMLPASSVKVTKSRVALTAKGHTLRSAEALGPFAEPEFAALLRALFGKRSASLSAATWHKKIKGLPPELMAAYTAATVTKALTRRGFVTLESSQSTKVRASTDLAESDSPAEPMPAQDFATLTPAQDRVLKTLVAEGLQGSGPKKPFLLLGVTGSGKTEVYLNLIRETLERAAASGEDRAQTIVLVPEISLTPQMTRVFSTRFPGLVAVVHSAMTDTDRWAELERMRSGEAAILIGPRSAVFGSCQNLKLIIVDEEHDSSYKQATGLTYNGRDVAVLRSSLEGTLVLLGSATPSMESYQNALAGKYLLLELPERVTGRPLPEVKIIAGENAFRKGSVISRDARAVTPAPAAAKKNEDGEDAEGISRDTPLDLEVVKELRANRAAGHQAIVLVNRRGYAYYLFSMEKRKAVQCPHCSISLTLHARSTILRCHYCDYETTIARTIAAHGNDTLIAIGYGSEKAEDCIRAEVPGVRVVRLDSDTVASRDVLPEALAKFRAGEIDVLVGTQILAKGHDFPNVTLIAILEVDQLLDMPDFRSGERTFQLIVQAAGRAGRAEKPGRVLIQSSRPGHPVIRLALEQNYKAFAEREIDFRRQHGYPPFGRMICVEFNCPDFARLRSLSTQIEEWLEGAAAADPQLYRHVRALGPTVPPIETIRGRHRRTVIFMAAHQGELRRAAQSFLAAFAKVQGDVRVKIDVDPQSLI